jgi:hypothetical protein
MDRPLLIPSPASRAGLSEDRPNRSLANRVTYNHANSFAGAGAHSIASPWGSSRLGPFPA